MFDREGCADPGAVIVLLLLLLQVAETGQHITATAIPTGIGKVRPRLEHWASSVWGSHHQRYEKLATSSRDCVLPHKRHQAHGLAS